MQQLIRQGVALKIVALSLGAVIVYYEYVQFQKQKKENLDGQKQQKFQTLKYLLIGPPGVGKTKLFKQFVNSLKKQSDQVQGFQECELNSKIDLVLTPDLEFEEIKQREIIISQFSQYMMNNHVIYFFLLVNFERTDLMKKKILNVLKFFKKFKEKITIIVTDFQLSDNQEEDKINLKQALNIYLNKYQSIMFVENDFNGEEFKNQLLLEAQTINLTDTIFEPFNENEQNYLLEQFQNKYNNGGFNKIEQNDNDQKQEEIKINQQQDNSQQVQAKDQQHIQQQEQQRIQINDKQLNQDDNSNLMNGEFKSVQNQI